jgi:hypothetical protein
VIPRLGEEMGGGGERIGVGVTYLPRDGRVASARSAFQDWVYLVEGVVRGCGGGG